MSLNYEISIDNRRATIVGVGKSDFNELIGVMDKVAQDPKFSSDFDIIADFRRLDYTPSFNEIKHFSSAFGKVKKSFPARVGFVVSDRRRLRLGRFASMLAKAINFELSVFEDETDAISWLERRKEELMTETKSKILQVLGKSQLSSLATIAKDGKPWVRYVNTKASNDLAIRFATFKESRKIMQIKDNPQVHLTCGVGNPAASEEWVQVSGVAEISTDDNEKRQFWNDGLKDYFTGPEDPNYVVVIVQPNRIEYMTMGSMLPEVWEKI